MKSNELTATQFAKALINSKEFNNRNLNNGDYIKVLYKAFFDRKADEDGYNNWLEILDSNLKTRDEVLDGFLNSKEFQNLSKKFGIRVK